MGYVKCVLVVFLTVFHGTWGGRCEKISTGQCKNLGYNSTLFPNFMGQESQLNAELGLRTYEPFLNHECSKYIRLFICSVFVPMCSEHVPGPIPACKGLCEKVKDDCHESLKKMDLDWPQELNCSRFPEPPALCMQQPPEENDDTHKHYFSPEEVTYNQQCPPNTTPLEGKCIPICKNKDQLDLNEVETFEIWVAVWSIICIVFTIFALITFIIQPKRFRWPARPILYLTSCGFVTCTIYLIRWIEGPYTCAGAIYDKPSESLSCVGISLILLFCDIAYTLWWTVFCFVWFLSAMKEWSTEAIEKISTRLHTVVWIFSAIPMFYILLSNNISINYLSGFCEVQNNALVFFQLFFMVISGVLAVLTSVALKNVRKTLISAGRSPMKLERLFYRLLIISFGICLPHFLYLICQFYDTFAIALLKLVLRKVSIIFATLWVYSPKTFERWHKLICFCKNKNGGHSERRSVLEVLFPKAFRSDEKVNNNPVVNKNIILNEKKTIFDLFFASSSQNVPVSRV